MKRRRYETRRWLLGAALMAGLTLAVWAALAQRRLERWRVPLSDELAGAVYRTNQPVTSEEPTLTWAASPAQSQRADWGYDIFTPPEIYYDPQTAAFMATPTVATSEDVSVLEESFGVELVAIKVNLFRLQIVGYVGGPGDYRGTFIDAESGETLVVPAGKTLPRLGVRIEAITVERLQTPTAEGAVLTEWVATAIVRDERRGETVVLNSREKRVVSAPQAVLRDSATGEEVELRAGECWPREAGNFKLMSVRAETGEVEITKTVSDSTTPLGRTLRSRENPNLGATIGTNPAVLSPL